MIKRTALIICVSLICALGAVNIVAAKNIQYGQADQQDMLRRSKELNDRARRDTRSATDRMHKVIQEKRDGQRGLDKDFMNRQGSGSGTSRQ